MGVEGAEVFVGDAGLEGTVFLEVTGEVFLGTSSLLDLVGVEVRGSFGAVVAAGFTSNFFGTDFTVLTSWTDFSEIMFWLLLVCTLQVLMLVVEVSSVLTSVFLTAFIFRSIDLTTALSNTFSPSSVTKTSAVNNRFVKLYFSPVSLLSRVSITTVIAFPSSSISSFLRV